MTLNDDIGRVLPELQAAAESRMTATADVFGLPTRTWVEETASYENVAPKVYSGPCRVRLTDTLARDVDAQGQLLVVQRNTVSFPVRTDTAFEKDFTVLITASSRDTAIVGTKLRVTGPFAQSDSTARRYLCEEAS